MMNDPQPRGIRFGLVHLFWAVTLVSAGLAISLGSWVLSALLIGKWFCKVNDHSKAKLNWNGIHSVFNILIVLFCLASVMLLSASGSVRAAVKRTVSQNNVRQILLALHNYESVYGHLPKNRKVTLDDGTVLEHSWRVELMPYIEAPPIYDQYDFEEPWDGPNNKKLLDQMSPVWECPCNPSRTDTGYKFVVGTGTAFPEESEVTFETIRDGTSNTVVLIEDAANLVPWLSPEDLSPAKAAEILNSTDIDSISHKTETTFAKTALGTVVGLVDGSSQFVGAKPTPRVEPGVFLIADDVMWDYEVEGHAIVQTKLQGYIALGLYIALMVLPYFLFKKLPVLPETTSGK